MLWLPRGAASYGFAEAAGRRSADTDLERWCDAAKSMFSRVLVGFDGSPHGEAALALAAALTARDGEVIVCCVQSPRTAAGRLDPSTPRLDLAGAQRCVERGRELLPEATLGHTLILEAGDVAPALLDAAGFHDAELLVLGSSHRGRAGQAILGSVAVEALHDPPCPVCIATVREHAPGEPLRIGSVAVGCDVLDRVGPELDLAVRIASDLGVALHVVAVSDTRVTLAVEHGGAVAYPAVIRARRLASEEGLAAVMASLPAGVSATGEVREGSPVEKLVEVSRGVDLLVLGAHHYGPVERLMGRSVSAAVRRHARCPLLVAPAARETTAHR